MINKLPTIDNDIPERRKLYRMLDMSLIAALIVAILVSIFMYNIGYWDGYNKANTERVEIPVR